MKIIEILKLNRELLNILKAAGIRVDDVKYIALYNEYQEMVGRGEKVSYAVAMMAERYGISERTVYMVLKQLQKDCNLAALG